MERPRPDRSGSLREDHVENCNTATRIQLEELRLYLLRESLKLKRPLRTLRMKGVDKVTDHEHQGMIQQYETKRNLKAIQEKQQHINILKCRLGNTTEVIDQLFISKNRKRIAKKLKFLSNQDNRLFKHWRNKPTAPSSLANLNSLICRRKSRRKATAKRRKLRKKKQLLIDRADRALERNLVINFTDVEVPKLSVAILSYGPGFIPTPSFNRNQFALDATNALHKLAWRVELSGNNTPSDVPLSLMKKEVTAPCLSKDRTIASLQSTVRKFTDEFSPTPMKSNLNCFELEGFRWLQNAIKQKEIVVSCADKGNAILLLTPQQMLDIQLSKLTDTQRYTCLGEEDPTPHLSEKLHELWCEGLTKGHISDVQAKKAVGIQKRGTRFTKSTSDLFKPGITYGYALLKVHKLTIDQLRAKTLPPARFVSDLSRSLTVRSDKFIAWNFLQGLSKDFATDLVVDSTDALRKLEELSASGSVSDGMQAFSFDVVSLYDSLSPALVLEALRYAITLLRPTWSLDFINWLYALINLSFEASFLVFRGKFYIGNYGIPTGGTLSVDLANITVKYVLNEIFNSTKFFSDHILLFSRFVDDGMGVCTSDSSIFTDWISSVNQTAGERFNLKFTYEVKPITDWMIFLDIRFKYSNGTLLTDINRKLTDACRFLEFSSFHPRHVFSSIVYSQGLRYRRIINNDQLFNDRLDELREFFIFSSYNVGLVDRTLEIVRNTARSLEYKLRPPSDENTVYWPCTYGPGYNEIRKQATEANSTLNISHNIKLKTLNLKVVPKRGPNLKDLLFKRKAFSLLANSTAPLGNVPCGRARCKSCILMSEIFINGTPVKSEGGTCTTTNCVYLAQCQACISLNLHNNLYVGKTTTLLSMRVNGHRSAFSQLSLFNDITKINDGNCLWAHLSSVHNKKHRNDFDLNYRFCVLKICDPRNLRVTEQSFIAKLNTLFPHGLNIVNSVTI